MKSTAHLGFDGGGGGRAAGGGAGDGKICDTGTCECSGRDEKRGAGGDKERRGGGGGGGAPHGSQSHARG